MHFDTLVRTSLGEEASYCGSTGVFALVTPTHYIVGNVGDSRAILVRESSKGTELIPLSEDHKPDAPEEAGRVRKAGGFVSSETHQTFKGMQTCHRINGKIAVSRAWGDFDFKTRHDVPTPSLRHFNAD